MASEDDKNESDDKDEPGEEASKPAAVPAKKKRKKRPAVEKPIGDEPSDEPSEEPGEEPGASAPEASAAPGSRKKLIAVAVVAALAIAVGGYFFARSRAPKIWSAGEEVNVEITIVAGDAKNLACAAVDEVAGRHCAFEAADKPWSKSPDQADDKTLKPYTTLDKHQLAGAGLWSQPALQGKLPTGRFTVACRFKVEGKVTEPLVRWASAGPFVQAGPAWPAGLLSDCKIAGETPPAASK